MVALAVLAGAGTILNMGGPQWTEEGRWPPPRLFKAELYGHMVREWL